MPLWWMDKHVALGGKDFKWVFASLWTAQLLTYAIILGLDTFFYRSDLMRPWLLGSVRGRNPSSFSPLASSHFHLGRAPTHPQMLFRKIELKRGRTLKYVLLLAPFFLRCIQGFNPITIQKHLSQSVAFCCTWRPLGDIVDK